MRPARESRMKPCACRLRAEVTFLATVDADIAGVLISDLRHILADLGLAERLFIEES